MSKARSSVLPPIPARHSLLGDALVYWGLVRPALWSHFDRVWIKREGAIPQASDGPLIVYMNHPSWWDGYMAFVLNRMVLGNRFQGALYLLTIGGAAGILALILGLLRTAGFISK